MHNLKNNLNANGTWCFFICLSNPGLSWQHFNLLFQKTLENDQLRDALERTVDMTNSGEHNQVKYV